MFASARAHSNIALVKYWGKRPGTRPELNLPATGSISMTLSELHTTTSVRFGAEAAGADRLVIGGRHADAAAADRVRRFLDRVRSLAGLDQGALVESESNFPASSGLASSASAFAALALAATSAAGLRLEPSELSGLARMGSGSAARSVFGGFVEMEPGRREDGTDALARRMHGPDHWGLRLLAVLTTEAQKGVSSRDAMERTARTSPYFRAWCELVPRDLTAARDAIAKRDLGCLGPIAESNCLRMHASALAADPPVLFWNPATVDLIGRVQALRREGFEAWFTIDAGPHVKVLCSPEQAREITARLGRCPGVVRIIECRPGPDAVLLS
jgi:diphosphomevalonate decarboxylase